MVGTFIHHFLFSNEILSSVGAGQIEDIKERMSPGEETADNPISGHIRWKVGDQVSRYLLAQAP